MSVHCIAISKNRKSYKLYDVNTAKGFDHNVIDIFDVKTLLY